MPEITYQFMIDGVEWNEAHLKRLEYERNLHMLHQMKRHGIEIKNGSHILSDDEIDHLSMEQAWRISIDTRFDCSGEDIKRLYKESLEISDNLWRELSFDQNKPMKVSRCSMVVHGSTLQNFMGVMRAMQQDLRICLAAHPEHLAGIIADTHLYGFEPFGMYGTLTFCEVKYADAKNLGPQIQKDIDSNYPISMAGEAFLEDGKTAINSPFHQFKPLPDGFEAKLAVYWPENTPDEIVSGHCLHLAMEFYEGVKLMKHVGGTSESFL
ncbi:MAG: hypothetical protein ACI3W5_03220 [Faecousia sp.]